MLSAIEREVLQLHPEIGNGFGGFVQAAPLLHQTPGGPAWRRWQDDWSLAVPTSLSPPSSWAWSARWGLPVHTPWLTPDPSQVLDGFGLDLVEGYGLPFLAAIPGIAAAVSAGVSAAGATVGTISSIVKAIRENESEEIKAARAEGASPAQIQAIRRKYRKQTAAARKKYRASKAQGRSKPKTTRKPRAKRRTSTMPSRPQPPPEEVARQIAAGLATAADIAHRTGMGIQEVSSGAAVDPWTGARVVHAVTPQAAPLTPAQALELARAAGVPGPLAWLRAPLVAGIPAWGVLLGGAGVILVGGLLLRGRR